MWDQPGTGGEQLSGHWSALLFSFCGFQSTGWIMDSLCRTPRFSPLVPGPDLRRYCDVRVSLPAPVCVPLWSLFSFSPCPAALRWSLAGPSKLIFMLRSVHRFSGICPPSRVARLSPRSGLLSGKRHRWICRVIETAHPYCPCPPRLGTTQMVVSDCLLISPSPTLSSAYVEN